MNNFEIKRIDTNMLCTEEFKQESFTLGKYTFNTYYGLHPVEGHPITDVLLEIVDGNYGIFTSRSIVTSIKVEECCKNSYFAISFADGRVFTGNIRSENYSMEHINTQLRKLQWNLIMDTSKVDAMTPEDFVEDNESNE